MTQLTTGDMLVCLCWGRCAHNCKFIKVTRKGFNILNIDTNRCILKTHVYAKDMAHKEFPKKGPITGIFPIPEYLNVFVKDRENDKETEKLA